MGNSMLFEVKKQSSPRR